MYGKPYMCIFLPTAVISFKLLMKVTFDFRTVHVRIPVQEGKDAIENEENTIISRYARNGLEFDYIPSWERVKSFRE
jgi:hypothetical protein